jgi:hypothetical protein
MTDVPAEVEQHLASMSEGDWAAFTARVRAPDTTEALRTAVAKHVSADRLAAVVAVANTAAFVGDNGQVDESKVAQHLTAMFGPAATPPASTGYPRGIGTGAGGRAEAERRFGVKAEEGTPVPQSRGSGGSAEAARRFGKGGTA